MIGKRSEDPDWAETTKSQINNEIHQRNLSTSETIADQLEEMLGHLLSQLNVGTEECIAYSIKSKTRSII